MISSIARVIANITPIAIVILFSKLTTIDQLGQLNYFISLITILGVFSDFGIPEAIQTFLPKLSGRKSVTPYLVMELALVCVTAVAVFFIDTFTGGQFTQHQLLMIIVITLASAANTVIIVFNGLLQRTRLGIYYLGSAVLLFGLTFGLFFYGNMTPVEAFLWARLISWIVFGIIPLIDLYIQGKLDWQWKLPFTQLRFTFNNFLVRAFYTLTFQWDSLLVSFVSGAYVVGFFRTVALVANAPLILSTFINTKLLPEYSALAHKGRYPELAASYRRFSLGALAVGTVLVLLSIPLSNWGLSILFSQEIADAGTKYFILLFAASWLYVLSIPALTALQALTKDWVLVGFSGLQAAIFVVLSTALYPVYGLVIVPVLLIMVNAGFALGLNVYVYFYLAKSSFTR